MLGGSKSSRLDKRLLHQDKLVDSVSAGAYALAAGLGNFFITADVKQGVDPAKVEAVIDEELQKLLKEGPTATELEQARTVFKAGFVRGIERIGGFGGKADALAECAVYTGNPGLLPRQPEDASTTATAADLRAAGKRWLGKGSHTLVVLPGDRTALTEDPAVTPAPLDAAAGRSEVHDHRRAPSTAAPACRRPTTFPELKFPALQRATLKNGTTVILAERHDIPVVQMSYEFAGGYAADLGRKLGTVELRDGHARRRRRRPRRAGLRQPRRIAGREPRCGRVAGRRQCLSVGAEGKPRSVARAVRRHAAQAALRPEGNRPRARRPGSPASSRRRRNRKARRCACCRRCCTATAIPTRFRSAAAARKRRSRR